MLSINRSVLVPGVESQFFSIKKLSSPILCLSLMGDRFTSTHNIPLCTHEEKSGSPSCRFFLLGFGELNENTRTFCSLRLILWSVVFLLFFFFLIVSTPIYYLLFFLYETKNDASVYLEPIFYPWILIICYFSCCFEALEVCSGW